MQDDPNFWECLEHLDPDLDGPAAALVEAAFQSDDALRVALDTGTASAPGQRPSATPPPPMYLRRVRVQGFRGIGPRADLTLAAGPGLTVVVGRNGCGKSSFAEALELALTGVNSRWATSTAELRAGWRNLHHTRDARVAVQLSGRRQLEVAWANDTDAPDAFRFSATLGERQARSHDELGWSHATRVYNPILTYAGIGDLARRRGSELYDQLGDVLGLGTLLDAIDRLSSLDRSIRTAEKAARDALPALKARLEAVDDERALVVLAALRKRPWDLAAIDEASRGPTTSERLDRLNALLRLRAPDPQRASSLADTLRSLHARRQQVDRSSAGRSQHLATLLEHALSWHTDDAPCPVCGSRLDDHWKSRTQQTLEQARQDARATRELTQELERRQNEARSLLPAPPACLGALAELGLPETVATCWAHLVDGCHLTDPLALADHLNTHLPAVANALAALQEAARTQLNEVDATWTPIATALQGWLPGARQAVASRGARRTIKAAKEELLRQQKRLVKERFEPLEERAKAIWEQLRQRSHVELTSVELDGARTNNRRRVKLQVAVDGRENTALGVMSQGEMHSLALSLFLPRLTHAQSPFRFLVLDDPVQAMDPFKVDGLARVLEEAARERQVVVFTHDARLPEALGRLRIEATVLRVERGAESVVRVQPERDPVDTYLEEARAVAHQARQIGPRATRKVIPGFCRSALEAFFRRAYRNRALDEGVPHAEIEGHIRAAHSITALAALGMFADPNAGDRVFKQILRYGGEEGLALFKACKSGAHEGWDREHWPRIDATRSLIRALERALG